MEAVNGKKSRFSAAVGIIPGKPRIRARVEKDVIVATSVPGQFRIYQSVMRKMGMKQGDYIVILKDPTTGEVGITKGWQMYDKNGKALEMADTITKAEREELIANGSYTQDENGKKIPIIPRVPKIMGSKLTSPQAANAATSVCTFYDMSGWEATNGDSNVNSVYSIAVDEAETIDVAGDARVVYPLDFVENVAKKVNGAPRSEEDEEDVYEDTKDVDEDNE